MAMRESDGLRAAVIIFFLLVVFLAVFTYVFFKNADDLKKKVAGLEQEKTRMVDQARKDVDEITALKQMIGYSTDDNLEAIQTQFEKDMQTYGATFPEENRFYRPILDSMSRELAAVTEREAAAVAREQELKGRLQVVEANKDKQIDTFKVSMDKIAQDVAGERAKFNTERGRITQNADKLAADLTSLRNEMSASEAKSKEKLREYGVQLAKLDQLNKQKTDLLRSKDTKGYENPDGRITWVNQRDNVVWINLGQSDYLKRQTNFSVYPVDANNLALPEKKGSIEVTRIIDANMAEARIIQDDVSDPILPGDKIHSPVWTPGSQDSFALVGFMDLNGDGRSDRDKVRDIIELNGGKVDMELLENGEVEGKLTLNTRYIVLGEAPTASEKNSRLIDNFSLVTGEAQQLGIDTVPVQKFVGEMGWHSDERTVQLGRGASAGDFKARFPEGVQRRSYGATSSEFQKRSRPPSTF